MEWKTSTAAWLHDLHSDSWHSRGPFVARAGQIRLCAVNFLGEPKPLCEHMCEQEELVRDPDEQPRGTPLHHQLAKGVTGVAMVVHDSLTIWRGEGTPKRLPHGALRCVLLHRLCIVRCYCRVILRAG